ncbi:hypothetical protein ISS30_11390 [bacterium]|nr:hypothetical protein [bacterium]
MKKFYIYILSTGLILFSCGRPDSDERVLLLDRFDNVFFSACPLEGFDELEKSEKLFAYYAQSAAVSGDPIIYKQIHPEGYEIKKILDQVITHGMGIKADLLMGMEMYSKAFWVNHGFYDRASGVKFIPPLPRKPFQETVIIALSNGARLGLTDLRELHVLFNHLEPFIFHPVYQTYLIPRKGDVLNESPTGFYSNISQTDIAGFTEKYPLNSQIVKTDSGIFEAVYRCGGDTIAPGMYAGETAAITDNLYLAREYANDCQARQLDDLIEYFRSGDPAAYKKFQRGWIESDEKVEVYLGFLENGLDPRNVKGAYHGMVYIDSPNMRSLCGKITDYFKEKQSGGSEAITKPADIITAAGDLYMRIPSLFTVKLEDRESGGYKAKTVLFVNAAMRKSRILRNQIFEYTDVLDSSTSAQFGAEADSVMLALTAFCASHIPENKLSAGIDRRPTLFESMLVKAEALRFVYDEENVERDIISDIRTAEEIYRTFLRTVTAGTAWLDFAGRHPDEQRLANALIAQYILDNSSAVSKERTQGMIIRKLQNAAEMKAVLNKLTAELKVIMKDGDWIKAESFLTECKISANGPREFHSSTLDRRIHLNPFISLITPNIELKTTMMGKILDVRISPVNNLLDEVPQRAEIVERQVVYK